MNWYYLLTTLIFVMTIVLAKAGSPFRKHVSIVQFLTLYFSVLIDSNILSQNNFLWSSVLILLSLGQQMGAREIITTILTSVSLFVVGDIGWLLLPFSYYVMTSMRPTQIKFFLALIPVLVSVLPISKLVLPILLIFLCVEMISAVNDNYESELLLPIMLLFVSISGTPKFDTVVISPYWLLLSGSLYILLTNRKNINATSLLLVLSIMVISAKINVAVVVLVLYVISNQILKLVSYALQKMGTVEVGSTDYMFTQLMLLSPVFWILSTFILKEYTFGLFGLSLMFIFTLIYSDKMILSKEVIYELLIKIIILVCVFFPYSGSNGMAIFAKMIPLAKLLNDSSGIAISFVIGLAAVVFMENIKVPFSIYLEKIRFFSDFHGQVKCDGMRGAFSLEEFYSSKERDVKTSNNGKFVYVVMNFFEEIKTVLFVSFIFVLFSLLVFRL